MVNEVEEKVTIPGPVRLEGLLGLRPGQAGLVVTHPHPLYGGSMDNNVVEALVRAGARAGLSTLRFNFRGVGASQGTHGQGVGEREDLWAALNLLAEKGRTRLYLAGYSFGAWVAATAGPGGPEVRGRIWIAPPLGMMPLRPEEVAHPPDLISYGERDSFCPAENVSALVRGMGAGVELAELAGEDHFFGGSGEELVRRVSDCLTRLLRDGR